MKTSVEQPVGTVTLCAPATGVVRWLAPETLCGELDVFAQSDPVASVGEALLLAPAHGFMVRLLAHDGDVVTQGAEVAVFGVA